MAIPNHIAIIMDGNGRWAKAKNLPRTAGHKQGAINLLDLCTKAYDLGVHYMTLYAFSTENWKRSPIEVAALMSLLSTFVEEQAPWFFKYEVSFKVIGQIDRIPLLVRRKVLKLMDATKHFQSNTLCLALSYGSRDELMQATRTIAQKCVDGKLMVKNITEKTLSEHLFLPTIPDPDLMIRTSGECRLSNFLLWQLAYTEFMFVQEPFPDFTAARLEECIKDFENRDRRFGNA